MESPHLERMKQGIAASLTIVGFLLVVPTYGTILGAVSIYIAACYFGERRAARERAAVARTRLQQLAPEIERWRAYERYLTTNERWTLESRLARLFKGSSGNRWRQLGVIHPFDPALEAVRTRQRAFGEFLDGYNDAYFERQRLQHPAFFNGDEFHGGMGLNAQQARGVLTNDQYTLVVAGPGSGKTRLLTDRVAFFTRKHADPVPEEEILILAFNRSAAREIAERLEAKFQITGVEAGTFHKLGFRILREKLPRGVEVETNGDRLISDLARAHLEADPAFQYLLVDLFETPDPVKRGRDPAFLTQGEVRVEQYRHRASREYLALDKTPVKSRAERQIANFFIQHDINYEYEALADWADPDPADPARRYHPDFYLPDYEVYLEHWGVVAGERAPAFMEGGADQYLATKRWKKGQFVKHGRVLWETDHGMYRAGRLRDVLKRLCAKRGIPLEPLHLPRLLEKIEIGNQKVTSLVKLVQSTIQTAKGYGIGPDALVSRVEARLEKRPGHETVVEREFFKHAREIYATYEDQLASQHKIDFHDMINRSVEILQDDPGVLAGYRQVLVDEFQDISHQRLELIKALRQVHPDGRLFCVGDDWQGIYGFAGASSKYMIDFERHVGNAPARVTLAQNYRCPPAVLSLGSQVIAGCSEKLDKALFTNNPPAVRSVVFRRIPARTERGFQRVQAERVFKQIQALVGQGVDPHEILVLSRFNFGFTGVEERCRDAAGIPVERVKGGAVLQRGVRFMSTHKAKGLEADHVFVLNVYDAPFGFPPQIQAAIDLRVINPDLPDRMDEERRLLFVAVTRAKTRCTLFTWLEHESPFLLENPMYQAHFPEVPPALTADREADGRKKRPVIVGRIARHTAKALCIDAHWTPSWQSSVWIPRSQVESRYDEDSNELQRFEITDWLREKKLAEFSEESS